ncbi:LysE family translocator [Rhodovulum sulfidophilum]|uniref:LysE family translocator n=1 Tax=Rhodovulum sulfidophilum TaxID=35806 RepID=A0ABS1RP09_RHOSU|nr:LysE family translocator [Rhodovulum sulfidophilum]MBL3607633.1 LysE family translocator [Rhodovulum sulfidophilum]MCE8457381.1 LysE family translocator [Rhodovulum sulfidophilum]
MDNLDLLLALGAFALVASITPGPNNLMLMASGANFGLRRTLPHILGVALGFVAMIVLVGLGAMRAFEAWPMLRVMLTWFGAAYLVWLAWKIARAAPPEPGAAPGRPMTFLQAAAFQWVNPKGWTMALAALTLYAPGQKPTAVLLVAGAFAAASVPSTGLWTILGTRIRLLLSRPARLRLFNRAMALLLLASLVPVFLP